jgi:1-deoxy-D-xylulose-5-phosphate reductoisomerase
VSTDKLKKVSYAQAIHHPKWKMGAKISIDSATLINKCFEIIEAFWYFNTKNITALYHPQTQIHAIVDYGDDAYAFISKPSMLLPIKQALTKFKNNSPYVRHFFNVKHKYTLEKIDQIKWKPIAWAYKVLNNPNSSLPIIINAANEQAIQMFKSRRIRFDQIINIIEQSINKNKLQQVKTINDVYKIDRIVREQIVKGWK